MDTLKWGPIFWKVLHIVSFSYPKEPTNEDKKNYYTFYYNLQNILPCKHCRENLNKNYKILPLNINVFQDRHTLSKYVYQLHELINNELNKDSFLTYKDVKKEYRKYRIKKKKSKSCCEY